MQINSLDIMMASLIYGVPFILLFLIIITISVISNGNRLKEQVDLLKKLAEHQESLHFDQNRSEREF